MSIYATFFDLDGSAGDGISSYTDNDYNQIKPDAEAWLNVAHIPGFCFENRDLKDVPQQPDDEPYAPWLRIGVGKFDRTAAFVNVDRYSALRLYQALGEWLMADHHPMNGAVANDA